MMGLRNVLDHLGPMFHKGGRFAWFETVFETVDQTLFTPDTKTRNPPHVRDALDIKRVMWCVLFALIPCLFIGWYNTGYQANLALATLGQEAPVRWPASLLVGIGYDPASVPSCLLHGLLHFLPIYLVVIVVATFWSILFAAVRKHDLDEGLMVTATLFTMILPPMIPLWQAALGISFAIVIGKEVFGGLGKNFVNPALAGWAFLYFAYPAGISGDAVWVAVDEFSRSTPLMVAKTDGISGILEQGFSWGQSFIGIVPGTLAAESTIGSLIGAIHLIYVGVASWRIMGGILAGVIGMSLLFHVTGSADSPMSAMPWHWHLVLGNLAFCAVYMATDPVSAAQTNRGRWIYGILIGFLTILIRVLNPAFPEGVMLAILFGNFAAPLLDYADMRLNVRRRAIRDARM
jgi:Na+-transporting NADH:ubiquinone oxidoreductase subunit B